MRKDMNKKEFKYSHMNWIEGIPEPSVLPSDKVFLWGAGKIGSVVAYAMEQRGWKFNAFIDSAKEKQGKTYCEHTIISPEELYKEKQNVLIILSCAFPNIIDELKEKGYTNVYTPTFLLKQIDFTEYAGELTSEYAIRIVENALRNYVLYYKRGIPIERLLFVITDKCTLRCKNCDAYMPYHTHPEEDSIETIMESFNQILDVCEYVDTVDILGGEPLVHSNINSIVRYFVDEKRCSKVTIISNGTVMPSADLMEIMQSSKCIFRISDYGKLSSQKMHLIDEFEKRNIRYEVTNYQYWDSIPLIQRTNESQNQLDYKFATCTANVFYVKKGKMFCCTFCAGLCSLSMNLIPNFQSNYVQLTNVSKENVSINVEKFIKQVHERKHIDACKYCPGSHCIQFENKQPVAEQAEGILPIENLFKDGKRI